VGRNLKQWLSKLAHRTSKYEDASVNEATSEQNDSQRIAVGPEQETLAALIEELKQANLSVRKRAIDALAHIGHGAEAAVPALTDTLRDRNYAVRKRAISALGTIGPKAKAAIPPLIKLVSGQDRKVQRMAADALLLIDPKGIALVDALNSSDLEIRNGATFTLARIGPRGRAARQSHHLQQRTPSPPRLPGCGATCARLVCARELEMR
jgi:HEAT repeat protein